jgi:hypothetical protein
MSWYASRSRWCAKASTRRPMRSLTSASVSVSFLGDESASNDCRWACWSTLKAATRARSLSSSAWNACSSTSRGTMPPECSARSSSQPISESLRPLPPSFPTTSSVFTEPASDSVAATISLISFFNALYLTYWPAHGPYVLSAIWWPNFTIVQLSRGKGWAIPPPPPPPPPPAAAARQSPWAHPPRRSVRRSHRWPGTRPYRCLHAPLYFQPVASLGGHNNSKRRCSCCRVTWGGGGGWRQPPSAPPPSAPHNWRGQSACLRWTRMCSL